LKHKTNHFRHASYLTLAIAALAASADAAVVNTPNAAQHDLVLAVRAGGGKGDTTTLLVNIGSYYQFSAPSAVPSNLSSTFSGAAPGSTFALNLGNLGGELTRLFSSAGLDWSDRTDLYWGIIGTNSAEVRTVYASRERTGDQTSQAWSTLTNDARYITSSEITSVIYNTNGYTGREATTGSSVAVEQPDFNGASSYNFQVSGPLDFGTLSQWSNIEGGIGSDLDLWRLSSAGVTTPGSFSISDDGIVSFTAVPEPSGAILTLGGLALALRRRRQHA
jgi:hypothetical protein